MVGGSCLCGGVAFEVDGPIFGMGNCHCADCRKAYGAAFGSVAVCSREDFSYRKGEELIACYRQSARINRYFCKVCGSPLPLVEDWDTKVGIPGGILDDDPKVAPSQHIFVGDKASWWRITDQCPQYDGYPPGGEPGQGDDGQPPKK